MSQDALPQLLDAVLRLPLLGPDQLRELIRLLPRPRASAEEMVRRGWITQEQFSSLFADPQQWPPEGPTLELEEEAPLDADGENWVLLMGDEIAKAGVPPAVERARPDGADEEPPPEPDMAEAAPAPESASPFEGDGLASTAAGGDEARSRGSGPDRPPSRWMSRAGKGLLACALFLGSLFAGVRFFGSNSPDAPAARQEPRAARVGDPARAVDWPPVRPTVSINDELLRDDLLNGSGRKPPEPKEPPAPEPPPEPKEPPPPKDPPPVRNEPPARKEPPPELEAPAAVKARPKPKLSLHALVRQVVKENRTEETARVGVGDVAYQSVPADGSILVGMEVTYAPSYNHNAVKSVRPIYQRPNGTRYDGPVCGNPTKDRERVVAKTGYAIGAVAIWGGVGIDGVQLTFMQIGPHGLNPKKTYLSKWLGGHGGSRARTFVNDGRPIVGIAGMRARDPKRPAFCLCLVTIPAAGGWPP
jgi:hypothetical protein